MFCPQCGANLPDDSTFCTSCGNKLETQQIQPEMNQQENVVQPTAAQGSAKSRGVSKKDFLANEASENVRKSAKNSTFAFLAAVVLFIVSAIVATNTAFYKLPIVSAVLSKSDINEMEDDLDELDSDDFDYVRDLLDEAEDEIDRSDYKAINKFVNKAEKMFENPSISNISSAVNQAQKLAKLNLDRDLEDKLDLDSLDALEDVVDLLNGLKTAVYIITAVLILLAIFAFLKKSVGLTVFTAIFAAPFVLSLAGFIWYVLILASLIAMAVMFSKINNAYKA